MLPIAFLDNIIAQPGREVAQPPTELAPEVRAVPRPRFAIPAAVPDEIGSQAGEASDWIDSWVSREHANAFSAFCPRECSRSRD